MSTPRLALLLNEIRLPKAQRRFVVRMLNTEGPYPIADEQWNAMRILIEWHFDRMFDLPRLHRYRLAMAKALQAAESLSVRERAAAVREIGK